MAVITLTKENFEQEVLKAEETVLVDFYATWCGPCQMMAPVVEEIASEDSSIKVGKLDIDANIEIAQRYGVMSIPTFIVFKGGEVYKKSLGAMPKSSLLEMLK